MLLLFDIDGTLLLKTSAPHRAALLEALSTVYGLADPGAHRVAAAGRTDTQIARDIAAACGLSGERFDARIPELEATCAELFAHLCPPDLAAQVAPGMADLLNVLDPLEHVRLSLLTGNYEAVARIKLERAGIGRHFAYGQGAFGSDSEQRDLLGPIARARAGTPSHPYPREDTTIIGDTPLDIACARADGLRIIAVATGPYGAEALAEADAVAPTAHALQDLLGLSE